MTDTVEYRPLFAENKENMMRFLVDYFGTQEPHFAYLNIPNMERLFDHVLEEHLSIDINDNVSFVAVDSGRNDKIVGIRISSMCDASDTLLIPIDDHRRYESLSIADAFINALRKDWSKATPDCRKLLLFQTLCVHPDYQRLGIARKLCDLSMERGRALACTHVGVAAAASKSQKLFHSMGFEPVNVVTHDEFKIDDKIVFPTLGDTDRGVWFMKRL